MPESAAVAESSLDRFIRNFAPAMLGAWGMRTGYRINILVGLVMCIGAAAVGVAAAVTGNPGMLGGVVGPGIAGTVNLGVGFAMKQRLRRAPSTVRLTSEARNLLLTLLQQTLGWHLFWRPRSGWQASPTGFRGRFRRRFHAADPVPETVQTPAESALPDETFDVLEAAAAEYNRIRAWETMARTDDDGPHRKTAPMVLAAADETMADVLHHAAILRELPEGAELVRAQAETGIAALKKLADQLESLQHATAPADTLSLIDHVTEALRQDTAARAELGQKA